MDFSFLLSNQMINSGVVSWCLAQLIKTVIDYVKHKKFNKERLAGSGGMPSSHAAVTCSVLLTSYYLYGFDSGIFAAIFILSFITMYDAIGVRWSAGLHAKAINHIVEYLKKSDQSDPEVKKSLEGLIPTLNESIGHRLIEVICGALLGFVVSAVFHFI